MGIRGKTKLGLAALVSALFGLGCKTTVTLGYEGKNSSIYIPVVQPKSTADVSTGFGTEPKKNVAHMLAGIVLGAGLGKAGVEEEWWEEGGAYGVGATTAFLYTWAHWDKPWNHKYEWLVLVAGGYGLAHEGPASDDSSSDLGGYDPGQGDDEGPGDDGDDDTGNLGGDDSDQDQGNM
jgi:hypothetical protein